MWLLVWHLFFVFVSKQCLHVGLQYTIVNWIMQTMPLDSPSNQLSYSIMQYTLTLRVACVYNIASDCHSIVYDMLLPWIQATVRDKSPIYCCKTSIKKENQDVARKIIHRPDTFDMLITQSANIYWIVNTLKPRENRSRSAAVIFKCISWMRICELQLKFHWSVFLWVQLTIFQHWFR